MWTYGTLVQPLMQTENAHRHQKGPEANSNRDLNLIYDQLLV